MKITTTRQIFLVNYELRRLFVNLYKFFLLGMYVQTEIQNITKF
jgi:hypothetical protein